jgi:hypothetical protein
MRYLYLPFSHYSADPSYTGTVDRYKRKGHKVIEHSYGWKPLRVLKAADVLIIMGHGGNGPNSRGHISVRRVDTQGNASYVSQTFNDLAAQLESDGLPKSHRVIKSLTCYGGGDLVIDAAAGGTLVGQPYEYFAQLLAKAMGLRGYASIRVGGYGGQVTSTTDKKVFGVPVINDLAGAYQLAPDGLFDVETKGHIVYYDAVGNQTTV